MKYIEIEINETNYRLEFTRDALSRMELAGFSLKEMEHRFMTSIRLMFWGALLKYQPRTTVDDADKLLDKALDEYELEDIFASLIDMVQAVFPQGDTAKPKKKLKVIGK